MESDKYFIGKVKWFRDEVKKADYGFINHLSLGDIFFHKNEINEHHRNQYIHEDVIVIFKIKKSEKENGNYDALDVRILQLETDVFFLFDLFLSATNENSSFEKNGFNVLLIERIKKISNTIENQKLFNIWIEFINQNLSPNIEYIESFLLLSKELFPNKQYDVSEIVKDSIDSSIQYDFYIKEIYSLFPYEYVTTSIYNLEEKELKKLFELATVDEKLELFRILIERLIYKNDNEQFVIDILKWARLYFEDNFEDVLFNIKSNFSNEFYLDLWINDYHNDLDTVLFLTYLPQLDIFNKSRFLERIIVLIVNDIFQGSLKIILESIISKNFNETEKNKFIVDFLNKFKSKSTIHFKSNIEDLLFLCPNDYKLQLWLEDCHEHLDFHDYKLYIISFNPNDQIIFLKKVFKYIAEKKINLDVSDLLTINTIDNKTSKEIELLTKQKIDYSVSIVLNLIFELNNNNLRINSKSDNIRYQRKLFDIILDQIEDPKEILSIKGFFDKCQGRTIFKDNKLFKNDYSEFPKEFCDGRLSVDIEGNEVLDNDHKFWWCNNSKCFAHACELHNSSDWESYSIYDFLSILNIKYVKEDLEIYISLINKVNKFLEHLRCRTCENLLRPIGRSNYAFYGVTTFNCINNDCKELDQQIYLSHCSNGFCESIIDSRDSVKCKPDGKDQNTCGWYVCNSCNACCTTANLNFRISIYNKTKQTYKCHTEGHRDLGIISCNKCGDEMLENKFNDSEYKKFLDWFDTNKLNSPRIGKNGINKFGQKWFIYKKYKESDDEYFIKLNKLLKLGFRIPDINNRKKTFQLISESENSNLKNKYILSCKACDNVIDFSYDFIKFRSIKKFHINHSYIKKLPEKFTKE